MRPSAEVLEGAVAVQRDGLGALVTRQVLDQLDLVILALGAKQLDSLAGGELAALEGLVRLDVLGHLLLDPREVLGTGALAVRKVDVVIEALGDRRADRDLRRRPKIEYRLGEHVCGVVADELQRLGTVLGDDLELGAVLEGSAEVPQLAVHLDGQRRTRQAGSDLGRGVGAGRALGQREPRAVRQLDFERCRRHGQAC